MEPFGTDAPQRRAGVSDSVRLPGTPSALRRHQGRLVVDGRLDVPWAVARAVLGSILAATHRLRFEGLENFPASGGAVVSGNHISVLDPIVVGLAVAGLGRKIHFLTVTEVSDHPVAAWTLRTLDQVSIRREAGDWRTCPSSSGGGRQPHHHLPHYRLARSTTWRCWRAPRLTQQRTRVRQAR